MQGRYPRPSFFFPLVFLLLLLPVSLVFDSRDTCRSAMQILDEADKMLSMDFEVEINKVIEAIPRNRTTFLFSATMTSKVAKLQRASLQNPVKVEVSAKYSTVESLLQHYIFLPHKFKVLPPLLALLCSTRPWTTRLP